VINLIIAAPTIAGFGVLDTAARRSRRVGLDVLVESLAGVVRLSVEQDEGRTLSQASQLPEIGWAVFDAVLLFKTRRRIRGVVKTHN
jgi:hypothetical protein